MKKPQFFNLLGVIIISLFALNTALANNLEVSDGSVSHELLDGRSLEPQALASVLSHVLPGSVLVLGEQHALKNHQEEQLQVIETLQKIGRLASVGMEFFTYTHQDIVEPWRMGQLEEAAFLTKMEWKGFSFDFYRDQVKAPRLGLEYVQALNSPRSLTGKVSKQGLNSLTEAEKALLPPNFTLGNARYFERFKQNIGHLPNPEAAERYFTSQSIWDDTMAWQAARFLKQHPEQVLVIIVGEFHVQYGGGLPDRLRARGVSASTISLVNLDGMTEQEQREALAPSSIDGPRADYIFVSKKN